MPRNIFLIILRKFNYKAAQLMRTYSQNIPLIVLTFLFALIAPNFSSGQDSGEVLFSGEIKIDPQASREFEYRLLKGEKLSISAQAQEDEPISTFKVSSISTGSILAEFSEKPNISSTPDRFSADPGWYSKG